MSPSILSRYVVLFQPPGGDAATAQTSLLENKSAVGATH